MAIIDSLLKLIAVRGAEGMVPLERNLARLVKRGKLRLEVAGEAASDPHLLAQMVRGR
ncbi:MAG: hypothetical protein JRI68_22760 [Deltaproteobacteria bacterium]|nr:hypothetical protein [Deltaproteobacteria bacterium]